jgi:hypothetical protein
VRPLWAVTWALCCRRPYPRDRRFGYCARDVPSGLSNRAPKRAFPAIRGA